MDRRFLATGQCNGMEELYDTNEFLLKCGIKRVTDVTQLNLSKKGLVRVPDLSRFPMLQHLWLNNNKITKFSCPTTKCCLTELYLQNNQITSISGALGHLTNLQVLLLYNNRLRGLEETMAELRKMQRLHTASFFLNPFTQESHYRHYVIHHLPSVLILDKREVKQEERNAAFQMFNPDRSRVLRSVAFGRRAESGLIPGNSGPRDVGPWTTLGTGITHVSVTPGKDISHRKKSVVHSKPT